MVESGGQSLHTRRPTRRVEWCSNEIGEIAATSNDNRKDIHRIISQLLRKSSKNHLLAHRGSSIIISEHGSRNSSKVHFYNNIVINKDHYSTEFGVLTTSNFWLIVAPHSSTRSLLILTRTFTYGATMHSSIHAVSGGKPPAGKGVVGLLSWHGSHFWVCITFCKVRHGDSVTKPDYYYSNLPEDQLIVTLFPNLHSSILPEDPSKSSIF